MTNLRQCDQVRCGFLTQYPQMCPRCASCKADPHVIDEDCCDCWNCLKDEGHIRNGTPDNGVKVATPIRQEEIIEVKK